MTPVHAPGLFPSTVVLSNSNPQPSGVSSNLTIAGLREEIGDRVVVALGKQKILLRQTLSLTFTFDDSPTPAGDPTAPAREAAKFATQAVEQSAELAAVGVAQREYERAADRKNTIAARLKAARDEQDQLAAKGQFKPGLRVQIADMEEEYDVADRYAGKLFAHLHETKQAVANLREQTWLQAAAARLPELAVRRAAVLAKAEQFAREVAAELLAIEATEGHLKASTPSPA